MATTADPPTTGDRPTTAGAPPTTDSPPSADPPHGATRAPGWREVLIVAAIVVAVVLGAAFLTGVLPAAGQNVVFKTPLAIVVIGVGTVGLLVWLARRPAT